MGSNCTFVQETTSDNVILTYTLNLVNASKIINPRPDARINANFNTIIYEIHNIRRKDYENKKSLFLRTFLIFVAF